MTKTVALCCLLYNFYKRRIANAAFSKSANNNKLIFKVCCSNVLKKVVIMLSLFDKFKKNNFREPFLKAAGIKTKFSIHLNSSHMNPLHGRYYNFSFCK